MFTMAATLPGVARTLPPTGSLRSRRAPRAKGGVRAPILQAGKTDDIMIRALPRDVSDAPPVDATAVTRREAFSLAALGAMMLGAMTDVANPAPALAAYGADAGGSSAVPSDWVEEAPSKVEKGAGGQDSRWVKSGSRGAVNVKCLTLNRAGEDGAAFDLTDKALQAIAGADSKLQESINSGTVSSTKDGDFVVFTISGGSGGDYAAKLTIDNTGRLFVFLASTPSDKYKGETKKTLDRMLGSFTTYKSVSQFV